VLDQRSRELKHSEKSALPDEEGRQYSLRLYVAGDEQNSQLARVNLKNICDSYLQGRCLIEEVDVLTDFASALKDKVFVTPTLILLSPEPKATVIGNLSDYEMVISALRFRM
jgi:circadian clock protein KaiB